MHSFTAVFAASALLATVSGSPLFPRGDVCGVAPSASAPNTQPLSQPSGIKTAADCQLQCDARTDCKSFIFGLVDSAIQCKLYSCDAAAIPKQASVNLMAYSKACSAVPSVVPTQANPTGKATGAAQQPASNTTPKSTGQTQQSNGQAQQSTGKTQRRQQKQQQQQQQQSSKVPASAATAAQVCGSKPAGSTNNQPIATPAATSVALCKKQCQSNTSCKSFTFGLVNNVPACRLFSVAASAIPPPSTTAQKNAFVAYDVGCSI